MARGSISLIVKGPIKSAKRAGARHGVSMESCRIVGSGKSGDVQCYAPCGPKTNSNVTQWFGSRSRSKAGRGFPPGTLLYHGAFCAKPNGNGLGGKKGSGKKGRGGSRGNSNDGSPTRTEVRSPTSTSTEVRSPTSTSTETDAYTAGNVTVTGGAGSGDTHVIIHGGKPQGVDPRHARGRDGARKARIHATDVQDRSQSTRRHATDGARRKRRR